MEWIQRLLQSWLNIMRRKSDTECHRGHRLSERILMSQELESMRMECSKNEEIYNIFDTDKFLNRPALVSVSNTSGAAGIAYWINAYYKLPQGSQVDKNSELVSRLKEWVDKEYEEGRVTVLTDDELIAKIDSICKELHIKL